MRYRLRHVTAYAYAEPVDLASHLLHLSPREVPGQRVLSHSLSASPEPSRVVLRDDAFGNPAAWLFLDAPHARFEVVAEAVVEVAFALPAGEGPPAAEVAAGARALPEAAEFLFPSPMLPASGAATGFVAPSFPAGRPVVAGLADLLRRFREGFTFRAGVTDITTPVARVLERREGVCQDFANVMVTGLRGLGIPARYVSGYVRTRPPPGQPRRRGADQSHAWVAAWCGPVLGWVQCDPTNDLFVTDEHVLLGWGRDFSDVSPLRGIILGGGAHDVTVSVDLEPAEAEVG
jgi:transglutaminase-like putative cysteine protease